MIVGSVVKLAHARRVAGLAPLYRRQVRSWPVDGGNPTIHQSVFDRVEWSRGRGFGPV